MCVCSEALACVHTSAGCLKHRLLILPTSDIDFGRGLRIAFLTSSHDKKILMMSCRVDIMCSSHHDLGCFDSFI